MFSSSREVDDPALAEGGNSSVLASAERVSFVDGLQARLKATTVLPSDVSIGGNLADADAAAPTEEDSEVGRKGVRGLTREEREKLGSTEYRALKLLSIIVPLYFFLWQFIGCISLGAWMAHNLPQPARDNAISPWWNGIFNGVSAFNKSGMSVLDLNMIPYGSSYFVLIVMGAMILAGNTAYPILLRLILWCKLGYRSTDHPFTDQAFCMGFTYKKFILIKAIKNRKKIGKIGNLIT
ncbi:cation transport protein-domain-containing protein [Durotheca rogersii]|uniref:cation transport protein-domain-containing protein n=1 Tax=Durotheca rogersii TaxID=419775 RepID=UPI00221EAD21|nr:cation transport protein-domain-containing protein [Durotheca rogersii]KAI5865674.1 cation transport protein-domain-containing protein [Durotheca rogersii]